MERMHMDTLTDMPVSAITADKKNILIVVNSFTKFIHAMPMSNHRAKSVITALTPIFSVFGAPKEMFSDNGSEFDNQDVREFLSNWGTSQRFTSPHNPQANRQAEAAVRIISDKLLTNLQELANTRPDRRYLANW